MCTNPPGRERSSVQMSTSFFCANLITPTPAYRSLSPFFFLHNDSGPLVYVLRFQRKKHSRKFQRDKIHRILYVHSAIVINSLLPCGVCDDCELVRSPGVLLNDVTNFIWFVGLHVRTQSIHSPQLRPRQDTVEYVRSQVSSFSFGSGNKNCPQASQCRNT